MIGEIIKVLRKTLDLTQQAFCERIGIKRNTIAKYETGRGEPIDAVVSLICREFNVREEWLRIGKGEMFDESPETQLDELSKEYNLDALDRKMMLGYLKLSVADRMVIKQYMQSVLDGIADDVERSELPDAQASSFTQVPLAQQDQLPELVGKPAEPVLATAIPEGSTPEIEAQVARIREQLIIEASTGTSGASTQARAG